MAQGGLSINTYISARPSSGAVSCISSRGLAQSTTVPSSIGRCSSNSIASLTPKKPVGRQTLLRQSACGARYRRKRKETIRVLNTNKRPSTVPTILDKVDEPDAVQWKFLSELPDARQRTVHSQSLPDTVVIPEVPRTAPQFCVPGEANAEQYSPTYSRHIRTAGGKTSLNNAITNPLPRITAVAEKDRRANERRFHTCKMLSPKKDSALENGNFGKNFETLQQVQQQQQQHGRHSDVKYIGAGEDATRIEHDGSGPGTIARAASLESDDFMPFHEDDVWDYGDDVDNVDHVDSADQQAFAIEPMFPPDSNRHEFPLFPAPPKIAPPDTAQPLTELLTSAPTTQNHISVGVWERKNRLKFANTEDPWEPCSERDCVMLETGFLSGRTRYVSDDGCSEVVLVSRAEGTITNVKDGATTTVRRAVCQVPATATVMEDDTLTLSKAVTQICCSRLPRRWQKEKNKPRSPTLPRSLHLTAQKSSGLRGAVTSLTKTSTCSAVLAVILFSVKLKDSCAPFPLYLVKEDPKAVSASTKVKKAVTFAGRLKRTTMQSKDLEQPTKKWAHQKDDPETNTIAYKLKMVFEDLQGYWQERTDDPNSTISDVNPHDVFLQLKNEHLKHHPLSKLALAASLPEELLNLATTASGPHGYRYTVSVIHGDTDHLGETRQPPPNTSAVTKGARGSSGASSDDVSSHAKRMSYGKWYMPNKAWGRQATVKPETLSLQAIADVCCPFLPNLWVFSLIKFTLLT